MTEVLPVKKVSTSGGWSLGAFALSCILLPLMVDNQSFWIDETCSAIYAKMPNWESVVGLAERDDLAEPMQPLSVAVNWIWSRLFGIGELALRSQNLVWGILALLAIAILGFRMRMPWLPIIAVIQPFFWFYMNELRPYVGQIAIGSWLCLGAWEVYRSTKISPAAWWLVGCASLALMSSSVLAPLTLIPYAGFLCVLVLRCGIRLTRPPWGLLILSFVSISFLCLYYADVLSRGGGGVKMWSVSPINLAYMLYEVSGASALGPALQSIREAYYYEGISSLFTHDRQSLIASGLLAGFALITIGHGWLRKPNDRGQDFANSSTILVLATAILLVLAGALTSKAFWGRHLAPIFPFWVVALSVPLSNLLRKQAGAKAKFLAIALIAMLMAGSVSYGYGTKHAKSDVRSAASEGHLAVNNRLCIWWISDWRPAFFYGLPVNEYGQCTDPRFIVSRGEPTVLPTLAQPDIVIFSPRLLFQYRRGVEAELARRGQYSRDHSIRDFILYRRENGRGGPPMEL